ncbi:hypothetical protein [Desulfovibrio legallii]|uniref:Uncharacterized protein n=1 Tax=Desulfovibrio legallii TaxID=571438 RepID=A0A1G7KVF1_9BACT|nr:hypothetical protein [Desulfovibrio legallii]SDF40890.1 hypothetical protein SAMN05192586_1055 [Desulfovibrio legallii]
MSQIPMNQTDPDLPLAPPPAADPHGSDPGAGSAPAAAPSAEGVPAPDAPAQDPFAQKLQEHEAAQRAAWQAQVDQWRREAAQDPHLGGENLAASVARAQLALDRFDPDRHIGRLLEETGYGNNPAVLRFFNNVADALMEDGLVRGEPHSAVMPPLEERMYAGWSAQV